MKLPQFGKLQRRWDLLILWRHPRTLPLSKPSKSLRESETCTRLASPYPPLNKNLPESCFLSLIIFESTSSVADTSSGKRNTRHTRHDLYPCSGTGLSVLYDAFLDQCVWMSANGSEGSCCLLSHEVCWPPDSLPRKMAVTTHCFWLCTVLIMTSSYSTHIFSFLVVSCRPPTCSSLRTSKYPFRAPSAWASTAWALWRPPANDSEPLLSSSPPQDRKWCIPRPRHTFSHGLTRPSNVGVRFGDRSWAHPLPIHLSTRARSIESDDEISFGTESQDLVRYFLLL